MAASMEFSSLLNELQKQFDSLRKSSQHPDSSMQLSTLARIGNTQFVEEFIMDSVSLKSSSFKQVTLGSENQKEMLQNYLYMCCFWGFRDIVKKMLELAEIHNYNIDVNHANSSTLWTPLHAAAFQEHGPIIMVLLEHGADPNSRDANGWSPIHFASVSDKIWSHFGARNSRRISYQELKNEGLIFKIPESPQHSRTVEKFQSSNMEFQATYHYTDNAEDEAGKRCSPRSQAALNSGDVLAGDQTRSTSNLSSTSTYKYY